jgi:hypothetical protein
MKTTIRILPVLLLIGALAVPAFSADDAAAAGARWTLKFTHGPLRIVRVSEGTGRSVSYHYMTVAVTNPTSLPRPWNPLAEAITDTKQTRLAVGNGHAIDEIRAAEHDNELVPIEATAGKIQPGETKKTAQEAGGTMPTPTVEYREIRESRVWSMVYSRPGDEFGRDADPIRFVSEDWKVIGNPETLRVVAHPGTGEGS